MEQTQGADKILLFVRRAVSLLCTPLFPAAIASGDGRQEFEQSNTFKIAEPKNYL
jgi:hypothetical protein